MECKGSVGIIKKRFLLLLFFSCEMLCMESFLDEFVDEDSWQQSIQESYELFCGIDVGVTTPFDTSEPKTIFATGFASLELRHGATREAPDFDKIDSSESALNLQHYTDDHESVKKKRKIIDERATHDLVQNSGVGAGSFYPCEHCEYYTVFEGFFKRHKYTHLKPYECNLCKKVCSSEKFLINHYKNKHFIPKDTAILGYVKTATTESKKNDNANYKNVYDCRVCSKKCYSFEALLQHLTSHFKKSTIEEYGLNTEMITRDDIWIDKPECGHDACNIEYESTERRAKNALIAKELRWHDGKLALKQDYIEKKRKAVTPQEHASLIKKNINVGSNALYSCDRCEYVTKTKGAFNEHIKAPHKLYTCKVCNKICYSEGALKQHYKAEHPTQGNKSICSICGYKAANPAMLRRHNKADHTKLYACQLCGKPNGSNGALRQHHKKDHPRT